MLKGQVDFKLIDSIEIEGDLVAVDRLNQLYILDEQDELSKIDNQGKILFQFSDNTLGAFSGIDVTDPFNVLIFFQSFQFAKILDRTLNPNVEFDFGALNLFNVQSIVNGVDNTIWAFDQQEGKLFNLDAKGEILNQSQDLVFLLKIRPESEHLLLNKNEVWLLANGTDLIKFDSFGQFQRNFKWNNNIDHICTWKDRLVFRSNQNWYLLAPSVWEAIQIQLPEPAEHNKVYFNNNYLYIQQEDRVLVYKF